MLQTLFNTYRAFVKPFLTSVIEEVLQSLASASHSTSFFEHDLNVISWLTGVAPLPPVASCLHPGVIPTHRTHLVYPMLRFGLRVRFITCKALSR